jgi:hypothetical protein
MKKPVDSSGMSPLQLEKPFSVLRSNLKKKLSVLALVAAAVFALSFAACTEDDNDTTTTEQPIQREFTITGFAKPITVKDMRTGATDTDLQTLGIIARLTAGLTALKESPVMERNLVIIVENTTEYNRVKAYSGNRLGVNFTYISTDDELLVDRIGSQLGDMEAMPPDGDTNPVACTCEQTYGTTAHLGTGETCPCPAPKPCGCTEQTAVLDTIPIYKEAGITVTQMNDAVANITGRAECLLPVARSVGERRGTLDIA